MSHTDKDEPFRRKAFMRRYYASPPNCFISHVWTARQRQAVRVDCLNAVKEYRCSGEVDTIPSIQQHRHGAQWLWS